jgi:hypothetical protein
MPDSMEPDERERKVVTGKVLLGWICEAHLRHRGPDDPHEAITRQANLLGYMASSPVYEWPATLPSGETSSPNSHAAGGCLPRSVVRSSGSTEGRRQSEERVCSQVIGRQPLPRSAVDCIPPGVARPSACYAALSRAPSGTMPWQANRQSSISSLRASAVTRTRRNRPAPSPLRALSQRASALSGCQRRHSQAISTITVRRCRLPALLMPCSRAYPPLAHGVPVRPAYEPSARPLRNWRTNPSRTSTVADCAPTP